MTFNPTVPLNSDSPAIFPAQNQTNMSRLQTIVGADHQFNLSAATNDGYHTLVHMIPQAPTGALAGIGRLYVKAFGGVIQLYYMDDAGTEYAITPSDTILSGTVNIVASSTFYTIATIPPDVFGEIFLWKGRFIQTGNFVSDGTVVNGYSYAQKYVSGSGASAILQLGFDGTGASGLDLRVENNGSGSGFNGIWNYKIFYRSKT